MTDSSGRRRRLAAILMADVVGFSRLMARDEEQTTARVVEFHEEARSAVERHGGRVVMTAGDSVFGHFDSIVEGLECAIGLQRSRHAANADWPTEDRIDIRIGLHLGDVIVDGTDVFGDGVNVAARLEQIADPGGIALSEAAYQLVRGRTDAPIERVGERRLKNITEPIVVYRIPPESFGPRPPGVDHVDDHPRDRIRRAVDRMVDRAADSAERIAEGVESGEFPVSAARSGARPVVVAPIRAGNLALLAVGVLGVLARGSGWSDNAWYPFLGVWLIAIVSGGVAKRLFGNRGLSLLLQAIGVGVGAVFFTSIAMRAALWVLAAGMLGASIRELTTGRSRGLPSS